MADSFLSIFKCLKKQPATEKKQRKQPEGNRRPSQVSPDDSVQFFCSKCGDSINNFEKKPSYSINAIGESDGKKPKKKPRDELTTKTHETSEQNTAEKDTETPQLCEKCIPNGQNTDAMSQSGLSVSTAYGSSKGRARQR